MGTSYEEGRTELRLNKLIKLIGKAIRRGDEQRSHRLGLEYASMIAARFEADMHKAHRETKIERG